MKNVLTIAGADPSGGAGIQADLSVFAALGVRGLSVITALTAQNRREVYSTRNVSADFVAAQIESLLKEFRVDAVKIGMTGSAKNIKTIERLLREHHLEKVVFDPVMRSTSGHGLLNRPGIKAIRDILPILTLITPNLSEAASISGLPDIDDIKGMEEAASTIHSMGAPSVLVKGGHLQKAPVDVFFDGKRFYHFQGRRLKGKKERFHGTGCVLSASIAAGLAKGSKLEKAVQDAKAFLEKTLAERV